MNYFIAVDIKGIKKGFKLNFVIEVVGKVFPGVFVSDVAVVFIVNFKEEFPEPFNIAFVDVASICDDKVDALWEVGLSGVHFQPLKCLSRQTAWRQNATIDIEPGII